MHMTHGSHEAYPLPHKRASRYIQRIERGSQRAQPKRTKNNAYLPLCIC